MIKVQIPKEILNSFFFTEKEKWIEEDKLQNAQYDDLFIHDIAAYAGIKTIKPWEEISVHYPELIKQWQNVQHEIKMLFDQRKNQDTLVLMKKGIGLLLEFVFWSNGLPVENLESLDDNKLLIKPVNFMERITFLIKRPSIYPSFIQLGELFEEHIKQYSKFEVMKHVREQK